MHAFPDAQPMPGVVRPVAPQDRDIRPALMVIVCKQATFVRARFAQKTTTSHLLHSRRMVFPRARIRCVYSRLVSSRDSLVHILFVIDANDRGRDIADVSDFDESEVLFPQGSVFSVAKTEPLQRQDCTTEGAPATMSIVRMVAEPAGTVARAIAGSDDATARR